MLSAACVCATNGKLSDKDSENIGRVNILKAGFTCRLLPANQVKLTNCRVRDPYVRWCERDKEGQLVFLTLLDCTFVLYSVSIIYTNSFTNFTCSERFLLEIVLVLGKLGEEFMT